ncbi:MAG: hypothetical protein R2882_02570 [Gemmatimonadales bacterium]
MIDDLRIHAAREGAPRPGGEFVLYWMQGVAMRSTANFALNFAVEQANALGVAVLVYQGLRHDYPWANDRHHTFILESAADLYRGLAERGIRYAFYLETVAEQAERGRRESPLVALARRAALVVTEFYPTFIQPRQLKRLREKTDTPVVAVDTTTVVPLRFHEREYPAARSIRPVLMEALPHHLFPVPNPEPDRQGRIEVPFAEPLSADTDAAAIAALVAACDIDHSVAPSPTLRGGERAARTRLAAFLKHGLPIYDEQRGDPNVDATSRLSSYLHFGNIAIQDVLLGAREAGPAPQYAKFLDEALVWRELAHNLTWFNPRHRSLDAVPEWARKELADHADDPRPARYSDEELETARTGDRLWNACQLSLIRDGELHNYLRMLWGKSVLLWTENAAEALRILEHLNHKYALDGRDPNSYGGILWCFGRYDRPFYRRPIFGTVRYMSLKAAEKKFDVPRYVTDQERRSNVT